MGDIADAIINGDMCQETGEWIGGGQGFPRSSTDPFRSAQSIGRNAKDTKCEVCGKKFRGQEGLKAHIKALHG